MFHHKFYSRAEAVELGEDLRKAVSSLVSILLLLNERHHQRLHSYVDTRILLTLFIFSTFIQGIFQHAADPTRPFKDENFYYRFMDKKRVIIVGGGFAGSRFIYIYISALVYPSTQQDHMDVCNN